MPHDPIRWPPAAPRKRVRGRWWFVAALVALAMAWFRILPITETTPIDVVFVAPGDRLAATVSARLAGALETQSGVRSVTVEAAGNDPCERYLSRFIDEPRDQPAAVIFVNPSGGDDPAAAARLGAAARRAGVSVGAIVERPGTAPGVSILLPSRWAAVADDPVGPRGNGAVVMISVTGLQRLASPVEIVLRGPTPGAWNAEDLSQQLGGEVQQVRSGVDGTSVSLLLDPTKTQNDALLYVRVSEIAGVAGMPWIEAELRTAGRMMAVDRWSPATRPPKVLLVPSVATLGVNPSAPPATAQDARRLGAHRGPPWSLLQRAVSPPGLVMVWPTGGNDILGPGRSAELENAGALRSTLPTVTELKEFEAVIIDASLPAGLTRERSTTGEPLVAGGLLSGGKFDRGQIDRFKSDLRLYVEGGGTLVLVGANVFAWEDKDDTLRSVLKTLVPHLADFSPAPGRSRWVFGIDNSESMMSRERAALSTLPPLLADKNVTLPYDAHTAAQYELLTGRPAIRQGNLLVQPTRKELAKQLLGRLFGGGGADENDIEGQNLASIRLVDTPAELAHAATDHLLATLGHPELLPEVNVRPAFRRHEPRDEPAGEPPLWALPHPFSDGKLRDLFGTHFAFPNDAMFRRPSATSPRAACVEWAPFRDYLAGQVFTGDYTRSLAWGFFDATDTGQEGANTTVWRVVNSDGKSAPLQEVRRQLLSLPECRQRFFFFAVPKYAPPPPDARVATTLDLSPGESSERPQFYKRFMRHGRGRWLTILEHMAARDLAVLRGEVPPAAIDDLREAGASPEAIDVFRRVVQEELRPAFATPYRPIAVGTSGWTILAQSTSGDPLAASTRVAKGRVVLALVEPAHDRALYQRTRDPAASWVDFSSLMKRPTETHPGQLLDLGFKLARVGDNFHVTAHEVRKEPGKEFWPPITTGAQVKKAVTAKVALKLYDGWDSPAQLIPDIAVTLETSPDRPWVVPINGLKAAPRSAADAGPRLLEIQIAWNGQETSVFAPLPAWLIEVPPGEDLGDVSPANRLIDMLLEVYSRKSVWYVERVPGRRTLRVWPRMLKTVPPALSLFAAGVELPPDMWRVDDTLPGQRLVRLEPSATWAGSIIEVRVRVEESDEVHFIDGFASDEQNRPLKLTPSVEAEPHPVPWSGVLDALATTTGPGSPPSAEDIAAHRGVTDGVFDGSDESARQLENFARQFVKLRSEIKTTRHWYLVALALAVVGIAVRRRTPVGGWANR